jgi:UDP-N-acetylglucosamine--N-acetylmuramyl-(pentapeptide) pyrophosphoryl-undecaprenol N-acetylglucosamine transferase
MEAGLVERAGISFRGVATGKLRGANPVKAAQTTSAVASGVKQSLAIIDEVKPHVCFVTGGYVCAPVVIASAMRKVPILIYLPDMQPGWTIKWMSKVADRIAVSFPEVAPHFGGLYPQGKAVVTGYPVRMELVERATNRAAARADLARALGRPLVEWGKPLLLVWGGSLGSRNINQSMWKALPAVLPYAHVLHVVGTRDWEEYMTVEVTVPELPPALAARYHPVPYLHEEMSLALAAADLSLARAGASTLGEFPVAHLPSILVPLVSVNQQANADLLVKHGGAVVIADDELSAKLSPVLVDLLRDSEARDRMEANLRKLAMPHAAQAIAQEIVALGACT